MTNIATLLFNNTQNPSIDGVCQFHDLLTINFLYVPDKVQRGVLFSFSVNFLFKQAPKLSIGFRSSEEGGHAIIICSLRPLHCVHKY